MITKRRLYRATRCKKHPRYKIKRAPRTLCEGCWRLWIYKIDVEKLMERLKSGPQPRHCF